MSDFDHKEFSRRGGDKTRELYPDHHAKIAPKGGKAVLKKYGPDHYKLMNQKSQESKKRKKEAEEKQKPEKKTSTLTKLTNLFTKSGSN